MDYMLIVNDILFQEKKRSTSKEPKKIEAVDPDLNDFDEFIRNFNDITEKQIKLSPVGGDCGCSAFDNIIDATTTSGAFDNAVDVAPTNNFDDMLEKPDNVVFSKKKHKKTIEHESENIFDNSYTRVEKLLAKYVSAIQQTDHKENM